MILCIDDDNGTKLYIKKGCIYTDYKSSGGYYKLRVNSNAPVRTYFKSRFIKLKPNKINKLLYKGLK